MTENDFIYEYTNDNIKAIVHSKYKYYLEKIKPIPIHINGTRATWKDHPKIDNMDGTYFHLITKDYKNKDGFCCPNRIIKCEKNFDYNPMMSDEYKENEKRTLCGHRIQCLYVIPKTLASDSKNLLIWSREESTPRGRRIRIKILNKDDKYFIIFDKRKNGKIVYWTSYPVNEIKIDKLTKEYEKNKFNSSLTITTN